MSAIRGHLTKASKKSINSIIKLASWLGDCTFDVIGTLSNGYMKALGCLQMFATQANNPIFELDRLPSRETAIGTLQNDKSKSSFTQQLLWSAGNMSR